MMRHRIVYIVLLLALLVSSCQTGPTPTPAPVIVEPPGSVVVTDGTGPSVTEGAMPVSSNPRGVALGQPGGGSTGLKLTVGEGAEQTQAGPAIPLATAQPVPAAQAQAVLARLPAMTTGVSDTQAFAFPPASLPAPRPGQTINVAFPPTNTIAAPTPPAAGPVEVLRHAPEGEVALAPNLSLTFSQPMVALTSHEALAAQAVPAQLVPTVPGEWRWVGTQTLMFEPKATAAGIPAGGAPANGAPTRFPMATFYTVTVPAGTASANGGKLGAALVWTFSTPPVQLQTSYPTGGPQRVAPLLFAAFDQRIDPAAVLKTIQVKAGSAAYTLTLATAAEVKADDIVRQLSDNAGEGRWLAFHAAQPFPADTDVTVSIGPGTPSAEGPRTTDKAQTFTFHTYGPLRIQDARCAWGDQCPPLTPWYINFTNPLDADKFDDSLIRIDPPLPGAKFQVMGNMLNIQAASQGRTTYKVTASGQLTDLFGQTMGRDQTVSFKVGSAEPTIWASGNGFVTLDPNGPPAFSVFTINYDRLSVQAYVVKPEDWTAFQQWRQNYYQTQTPPAPPGQRVIDKALPIKAKADELVETAIDLTPALKNGLGQLVLVITPDPQPANRSRQTLQTWVQSTRIGLDAAADPTHMVAWANALTDGKPLANVDLSLLPGGPTARTGADGTASLTLPASPAAMLLARLGDDTAVLPWNMMWWDTSGWQRQNLRDVLRWMVFDDRGMYRPGEDVHIKGWLRRITAGPTGDVAPLGVTGGKVAYQLTDAQGNKVREGTADVNLLGGFDTAITLPAGMNLGSATILLTYQGGADAENTQYNHAVQVQEFRRPEFEVTASAPDGPFFVGGSAVASVTAKYYAGGALPNAEVNWQVTTSPGSFAPPNWDDFTFGTWRPWWEMPAVGGAVASAPMMDFGPIRPFGPQSQPITYTGHTDAAGTHLLRLNFDSVNPPQPTSVTAQATVLDVNRQAWTSQTTLLVHPSSVYVGLRGERVFVEREQPLNIDAIAVDLDGKPVAGLTIKMQAARLDWQYIKGTWQEVEVAPQPCTITSTDKPVRCTFETPEGGTYRITATVTDDQGRPNQSQITRWVSGGKQPPQRDVTQEQITLIPDKKEYRDGDTAEILVQAPFYPAEGLMTLRRAGLVTSERFTVSGPSYTLKIPIKDAYTPNVYVQVDLVGAAPRAASDPTVTPQPGLPNRPAYATGTLNLSVPPFARTLKVDVAPAQAALAPGAQTTVAVTVTDAAGKPVQGGEVAVIVVDESVLALTNYQTPDPLSIFYSERSPDVSDYHLRGSVILANPDVLQPGTIATQTMSDAASARGAVPAAAPAATAAPAAAEAPSMNRALGGRGGGAAPLPPIALRTNFNALAVFAASLPTDAQGRAQVAVKVPDNLTRYRIMAVAVDGDGGKRFGSGAATLTARLPLMVRASPPRFLNFGDRFELPVVLQNQTDQPMTVTVAARGTNVFFQRDGEPRGAWAAYQVAVPANNRVEVRFPASTENAGTARFQVGAVADNNTAAQDASQFELPVWTPATTEAFATYGQIDAGSVAQPVIMPSNVYTQFGGLEVSTSSTALQALTDAVLYLQSYPFECSEQLASRVLAVASLKDVLTAFHAKDLPSPEEMTAAVNRDIAKLQGMQNEDGGFPVWQKGDEAWPYLSIHVAHALIRARDKDFTVPDDMLTRSRAYLQSIESHIPSWYGESARQSLIAYALYVRNLMGDRDTARSRQLFNAAGGGDKLPAEAVGWILSVLTGDPGSQAEVTAIRRYLTNHVTETAGEASFVTSYGDDAYLLLHSNRRTDAVMLDALMADQPQSDLIPKLVAGLLAHRTQGRWGNTQENAFVLLALDRYFNTYEAQTPNFVARLWLGAQFAGEATFQGRTTDRQAINIPMAVIGQTDGAQNLLLSKEGAGRLYYRLGMSYAPTDLNLLPLDRGFTVERTYEAVDNPADVRRDADGVWHVKAGALVRSRVTMVAQARRYHVALTDPLPAGFEAVNPALAVSGSIPWDQNPAAPANRYIWWWGPWYQHQNLRDQRAEAFTTLLWEGVYTYSYVSRATTPGSFIVPPAKAEEMYAPETFGRSATDHVIVE
jgi:alpha-2-macroglobulin